MTIDHSIDARVPYDYEHRRHLMELDFPVEEFERRVLSLQDSTGLDAIVVHGGAGYESNVRYLGGFASYFGDVVVVVPRHGDPVLITNAVYHGEPLHSNLQKTRLRDVRALLNPHSTGHPKSVAATTADLVRSWGVATGRVGLADLRHVTWRFRTELGAALPQAEFVDATDALLRLRRIKSPAEQSVMRRLGEITTAGMDAGLAAIAPGVLESEIAGAVYGASISAGAERMRGVFALSGPRSFLKNATHLAGKRVQEDELVVIDMGAFFGGYQSDMSRNAVAGKPGRDLVAMLDACLEAEEVGLKKVGPGVPVAEIVSAMRSIIGRAGFSDWDWSTGHGCGMDLVEEPHFNPEAAAILEPGMTFFIEPMIVPTHVGTICIEDLVLVTESGCEQLTTSRKRTWNSTS